MSPNTTIGRNGRARSPSGRGALTTGTPAAPAKGVAATASGMRSSVSGSERRTRIPNGTMTAPSSIASRHPQSWSCCTLSW